MKLRKVISKRLVVCTVRARLSPGTQNAERTCPPRYYPTIPAGSSTINTTTTVPRGVRRQIPWYLVRVDMIRIDLNKVWLTLTTTTVEMKLLLSAGWSRQVRTHVLWSRQVRTHVLVVRNIDASRRGKKELKSSCDKNARHEP